MMADLGGIGLGLVLLYFGAEGLVGGSARLGVRFGIPPLIVGLTVVAYGTSSPELVVSLKASLAGQGSLAIGNVIGSNIFNVAFILGLCSLVRPARADSQIVRRELPIMVGVSGLLVVLLADRELGRWDGVILLATLAGYTSYAVVQAWRQRGDRLADEFSAELTRPGGSTGRQVLFLVGGGVLLVAGGRLFLDGAVDLARHFGMSDAVIGLTIVAAGTGLPELAASLVAALRKEDDIAVGNVVGSNIFNVLGILGLAALVQPAPAEGIATTDLVVLVGSALLLVPLMRTGFRISRWEGAVLLGGYAAYLWHLLPTSTPTP